LAESKALPRRRFETDDSLVYGVVRLPVHPEAAGPRQAIEWHESPMIYLKKILVTTDLSECSLAGMDYATTFALLYSSEIHLLHVVEEHHANMEEARTALEVFIGRNINPDIQVVRAVRAGQPAAMIMRYADEEGVDLIVMATHGRAGLRHKVIGSVTEKVVRLTTIPVLAVKPHIVRENLLRNEDVEKDLHLR
jgi:nucleotide-binding universal stress UspA family protein